MEVYFLKSVACLAIFLLFYKLLLEKEHMHVFKRFYLLTAMLAAVAIPFITFTTYVEPSPEIFRTLPIAPLEGTVEASAGISEYLETGLWIIYILGVFFFSLKFCRNFVVIIKRIRKNPKVKDNNFITVLLSETLNPHTFFSYIFLNKVKYEKQEIPQEVIIHEQAHAVQKHSLDILLVEIAQIIFWFNPLLFLLKDAIKLNHEFLADDSVLKKGTNPTGYKKTLLSYSSGGLESSLVNPINYSSIKKRFTVMKTKTSKTAVWARSLLVLPLLAILVYGFSTKEVVEKSKVMDVQNNVQDYEILELNVDHHGSIYRNEQKISIEELQKIEKGTFTAASINASTEAPQQIVDEIIEVIRFKGVTKISICSPGDRDFFKVVPVFNGQEKATPEMVAEYNTLVKLYNSLAEGSFKVKQDDANRMMYILSLMTPEQKQQAEKIHFDIPPPPPPAPAPEPVKDKGKNLPAPPPPVVEKTLPAPPPPPLVEDLPQAPPPPPPITFEELVKDGAVFYYNDKIIEPEEARKLVEVEKKVNIQITSTDDEKPVVRLTDKKDKN